MKIGRFFIAAFLLMFLVPFRSFAQMDELRDATGLPFSSDQAVIWGQVTLRGLSSTEEKPTVHVSLQVGGTLVERMRANDRGYFYFLRAPRNGSFLVFEINELEIGRQGLTAGSGIRLRQDLEIDWQAFRDRAKSKPSAVSAAATYQRSPENEALMKKALATARSGSNSDAAQYYDQIIAKDPKDFVALTERGTIYFTEKKYSEAESVYTKALELSPKYVVALMNLGKMQLTQKKFDNAIATFTALVESDDHSADAFHYLGEAYLQAKLGSKAVVYLNEALRLAPIEKAEIHLRLATLYNAAGAKQSAANEYKLYLEKNKNHPDSAKMKKYIEENLK